MPIAGADGSIKPALPQVEVGLKPFGAQDIRLELIEGADHWCAEKRPAETAALIGPFAANSLQERRGAGLESIATAWPTSLDQGSRNQPGRQATADGYAVGGTAALLLRLAAAVVSASPDPNVALASALMSGFPLAAGRPASML